MSQLKDMKKQLINMVQEQLSHPETADTKEIGEVIDMIKDISETIYYCSVVKAMEDSEEEKEKMIEMTTEKSIK